MHKRFSVWFQTLFLCLLMAAPAFAEATVKVKVRTPEGKPADGKVTLTPKAEGEARSCTTVKGTCEIRGVPGGRYTVTLAPKSGTAPSPKPVMIAPAGEVELIVSTGG